ncbi:hypothetical protein HYS96_04380 [Candidatus Daviesbacteria bacterium]|nr:hypothetical protein [Candidatus Daviesbacteria bacterium]
MVSPKKSLVAIIGLIAVSLWILIPQSAFATSSKYYDFGPYYGGSSVLGFSFSNLENLPVPQIADSLMPPKAGGILPDNPFYALEKVVENVQLTFTFDPVKKEQLRLDIASERLSEAKTLMDQGKTQAASQALDDYGQTLTALSQNLAAIAQRTDPAAQALVNKAEEVSATQAVVTQALSLTSSPAQAESWTQATNITRYSLDKVAEAKGEPAIPTEFSSSIQQLKEQGLISEEESNKLYSFKNRSEVRDELNKLSSSGQFPISEAVRLDDAVTKYFPDVQKQYLTNLQVVELKSYQTLPQPDSKTAEELKKWQANPATPPSNDIKPYLWYNRAQDLARDVDLSNFSPTQQGDLVKFYPQAVQTNPTYSPPPSPSPVPADASPAPSPTSAVPASPTPSPTPPAAEPYLQGTGGALPGEPFYFIKQWGEGLTYTFTFDPAQKARLRMQEAERRLAEAEALANDPKKATLYESTLKSYQQTLADASNIVKNLKDTKASEEAAARLEAQAARHEVVFEKGLLPPPPQNPTLTSDVIRTAEDAMDRSADVLDRPALPPVLASRLQDLKAQGLILPEEAEDLTRSASREEAREKIRKLVELNTFPPADAKKLDEAQAVVSPADYNQLVEVRKVEELQSLRSVQTDLAQTPTLRSTATTLAQKEVALTNSFDPTLIKPEDLGGKENLIKAYERLTAVPRPINGGQFGPEVTPGAQPSATPRPQDAVLSACPEGATFKQSEGCIWADNGKRINDYDQYKCEGPRQYYSFAVKKCVASDSTRGYQEDAQPICPVGYSWNWQAQSCQTATGGILPFPSPSPVVDPINDEEREARSKSCPEGASYQPPNGCVWDKTGKSVYDPEQYRCGRGQYYSFEEGKCVASPKEGEPYPKNTTPVCKEDGAYWSWNEGKCIQAVFPSEQKGGPGAIIIDEFRPPFIAPNSPFYIIKQAAERVQLAIAFTAPARERVSLSQAKERLIEAADALKRNDEGAVKKALDTYTSMMQDIVSDVSKEQLTEGAKIEIGKLLAEKSVEQNLLLQKLQALAPSAQDTAISAAVSATILGVDKAADVAGEPPIPDELRSKIEALPEKMISEEDKKKLLEMKSRVEARLQIGGLVANGALTQTDTSFLNEDFDAVDQNARIKVEELKKLEEIADAAETKDKLEEKIGKNEEIAQKLQDFEKTFEPGKEVPAEIRPYIRLTRINEIAQTVRPDTINLEDFSNRKDLMLAVATLQEEYRPTIDALRQVEDFRRRNPNAALPLTLARVAALSVSLGVREKAGPCYLPTPLFPANTPCPAPGAAIPISSFTGIGPTIVDEFRPGWPGSAYPSAYQTGPTTDKDGNPLVYGQGPQPTSAGVCPSGSHWMYDSGGWCMSNSGNYSSSYSYTPSGTGSGYTPYSPYYTAPGAPPASYGYPGSGSYSNFINTYSPPNYWSPAPTNYTTTPPTGTVPGSGPRPTAPGQCPSGYHWMSDSGGWCMADGPTYVPSGSPYNYPAGTTTSGVPSGSLNCGSQSFNPATGRCNDGACPGGFNWDGSRCVASSPSYYSPNLNRILLGWQRLYSHKPY